MAKPSHKALGKRKAQPAPASAKSSKKSKTKTTTSKPSSSSQSHREIEVGLTGKPKRRPDQPKKIKLRDQKVIPVPKSGFAGNDDDSGSGTEDEDGLMDLGEEEGLEVLGGAGAFLAGVNKDELSRSTKETQRLHTLSKAKEQMPKLKRKKLGLPAPGSASSMSDYDINSDDDLAFDSDEELGAEGSGSGTGSLVLDDDDEKLGSDLSEEGGEGQDEFNAAYDEDDLSDSESDEEDEGDKPRKRKGKDEEAEYELSGRSRWIKKADPSTGAEADSVEVGRLPIKLPSGEIQMVAGSTRIALPPSKKKPLPQVSDEEEEEEEEEEEGSDDEKDAHKMAGQKGRFGRMGIAEIVGKQGWKNAQRLEAAKEQVAAIGAEILAGGELIDNGPLLTRLSTFALHTVPALEEGNPPLPVPTSIRGLALLSQLAVYKDLIPGYRIRQLTAAEESEKVRDEVRRLREGEKMLVRSYKGYLKMLENEIKRRSPLASLCLNCLCELLTSATHFNFSENIMGVLVGRVARKSWDDDADLVLQTLIDVFRSDHTGMHAQTLVRLIARMIKERKFQVHPNVLSAFLQLRLRKELDGMRDGKKHRGGGKGRPGPGQDVAEKKFKSEIRKKWATKNQKKREKEMKEVEAEMAEAEAEVDKEERAQVQTETLKNLFVLYFSILKHPGRSPLLAAALSGISHFAHFINVDFFRDLLIVLRRIIVEQDEPEADDEDEGEADAGVKVDTIGSGERVRIRLLGIVTAFELLSGQGEALNIDLNDFINALFALLRPLALDTSIEDPPYTSTATAPKQAARPLVTGRAPPKVAVQTQSTASLLFRCLHAIFFSRHSHATSPALRTAAFAKRLVECSLSFPPATSRQAIEFTRSLMAREPKLEGMLDTEERMFDGVYKPEMDDPQLINPFATSFYEVDILATRHWDKAVRAEAAKLREGNSVTQIQR